MTIGLKKSFFEVFLNRKKDWDDTSTELFTSHYLVLQTFIKSFLGTKKLTFDYFKAKSLHSFQVYHTVLLL